MKIRITYQPEEMNDAMVAVHMMKLLLGNAKERETIKDPYRHIYLTSANKSDKLKKN